MAVEGGVIVVLETACGESPVARGGSDSGSFGSQVAEASHLRRTGQGDAFLPVCGSDLVLALPLRVLGPKGHRFFGLLRGGGRSWVSTLCVDEELSTG